MALPPDRPKFPNMMLVAMLPSYIHDRAGSSISIHSLKEVFNTGTSQRAATPTGPGPESQAVTSNIDHRKNSTGMAKEERRSSMEFVKDLFTSLRRSSISSNGQRMEHSKPFTWPGTSASITSRSLSTSSRRSSRSKRLSATLKGSSLQSSPTGSLHRSESKDEKMLRRMSAGFSGSSSSKNYTSPTSPTLREENVATDFPEPPKPFPPQVTATEIGDLNVHFPNTLLWKRRHLLLDSQGSLVLLPIRNRGSGNKVVAGTKRYHLSELKCPVIPDIESEELPNSVNMEFLEDGGESRFACEDRATQRHFLRASPIIKTSPITRSSPKLPQE